MPRDLKIKAMYALLEGSPAPGPGKAIRQLSSLFSALAPMVVSGTTSLCQPRPPSRLRAPFRWRRFTDHGTLKWPLLLGAVDPGLGAL